MRHVQGLLVKSSKFHFPCRMLISGSSGTGKTSFTLKLIEKSYFSKKIRHLHYFGCLSQASEKLDWHTRLENVRVSYYEGLPSADFFDNIEKNSLVVVDDMYEEAINSPEISRAFRVDSRHKKFGIILITQSIYEKGRFSKSIRNNCEIFVLFRNFGDALTNSRLCSQLDLKARFKRCSRDADVSKYGYTVINNSPYVQNERMRVSCNIFGEIRKLGPFPRFYTDD